MYVRSGLRTTLPASRRARACVGVLYSFKPHLFPFFVNALPKRNVAESSRIPDRPEIGGGGSNRENADKPLFSCFFEEILYPDRIDPEFLYYIQTVQH